MDWTLVILWTITLFINQTGADLPSCERARCHHCRVTFIAKMCPETCKSCPKDRFALESSLLESFVATEAKNDPTSTSRRPQAKAVNTQQLLPQQTLQKASYAAHYNSISPFTAQESSNLYAYQYLPQQTQQRTVIATLQKLPSLPLPSSPLPQPQQILLTTATAFPVLPTFTFPFTFPTVTFGPPVYRIPVGGMLQSQVTVPPSPQKMLPDPLLTGSSIAQTEHFQPQSQVAQPSSPGLVSHLQTFPHPQQLNLQHYAVQQQTVSTLPASRQPQPYVQQVWPQQRKPTYSQFQQLFYGTNQQAELSTRGPPLQPQPTLPAAKPSTVLEKGPSAVEYSIDEPSNFIKKTLQVGKEQSAIITKCPRQPNWEPCITKETANERFKACCQGFGQGCMALCNYDATLTTIQLAVLTGRCPLSKVGDVMICASGYEDATPCCEAYNVFEPGYEHCRPYCNPSAGLPHDAMLSEQYKCLGKLSQIQRCFYASQQP